MDINLDFLPDELLIFNKKEEVYISSILSEKKYTIVKTNYKAFPNFGFSRLVKKDDLKKAIESISGEKGFFYKDELFIGNKQEKQKINSSDFKGPIVFNKSKKTILSFECEGPTLKKNLSLAFQRLESSSNASIGELFFIGCKSGEVVLDRYMVFTMCRSFVINVENAEDFYFCMPNFDAIEHCSNLKETIKFVIYKDQLTIKSENVFYSNPLFEPKGFTEFFTLMNLVKELCTLCLKKIDKKQNINYVCIDIEKSEITWEGEVPHNSEELESRGIIFFEAKAVNKFFKFMKEENIKLSLVESKKSEPSIFYCFSSAEPNGSKKEKLFIINAHRSKNAEIQQDCD